MDRPKLVDLFNVPSRYYRSVQLERDFEDPSALENYVVTPAMASASARILKGLQAGSAQRAWRVTGDYGVGKSSFALMLARLLGGVGGPDVERIERAIGRTPSAGEPPLLPLLVTGAREGLTHAVERGVLNGLAAWGDALPNKAAAIRQLLAEKSDTRSTFAVDEVIAAVRDAAQTSGAGVLLIIDELGKLLEHAAQNPNGEDVFLLQRLAEQAARSGNLPFVVVGLLHQGFHAYAERLPVAARHEWDKVAGRYEEIVFDQPLAHTTALVAGALGVGALPAGVADQARDAARATGLMGWLGGQTASVATMDATAIYPLHPTLLPPLVRFFAHFGQNERSLFGFLLSNEPYGLQAFSETTAVGQGWYGLADLYDYVRSNFGHRLAGHSYQNQWLRIVNTIDAHRELSDLQVRLLKAIGLLNLLDSDDLLPTGPALVACFSWIEEDDVGVALQQLVGSGVLFDRGSRTGFRLWPNTSVNLGSAYQNAVRAIGPIEHVATHMAALLPGETLLARRHYLERGTMRYFDLRYATARVENAPVAATAADGIVIMILPNSPEEQREALGAARRVTSGNDSLVCGVTRPVAFLAPEVLAIRCWEWVRDNTPELSDDAIAAEEVSRQLHEARRSLAQQFSAISALRRSYVAEVDWFHVGEPLATQASLVNELSRICDDRFFKAPRVANELVNKSTISSAAASARMRLIEGIFRKDRTPLLGIDPNKAPPEKSMYLSIFAKGGLHVDAGPRFELREPLDEDPLNLAPAMQRILFLIRQGLGGRVSIKDIFDDLRLPPYGVRDGLSPLLLATVLKMHAHELAMYESGTFIANFGALEFMRLTKAPATFEVQYCSVEGVRSEVFGRLAQAFVHNVTDRQPVLLDIVTELSQFAAKLPEYTRRSRKLEPTVAAVRDALLTATEPATLMFVSLPKACGLPEFDLRTPAPADRAEQFVDHLSEAVSTLRTDYATLLERIVSSVAIALGDETSTFDRDALSQRAAGVSVAARDGRLRAFALRLRDAGLSKDAWAESLASLVVAKPPAKWAPGDEQRFMEEMGALAELFGKIEATAFGSSKLTASKDALRVNVTLPDGTDYVHVVNDARLNDHEQNMLEAMSQMLPKGDGKRIQFLANLLFKELAQQTQAPKETAKSSGIAL